MRVVMMVVGGVLALPFVALGLVTGGVAFSVMLDPTGARLRKRQMSGQHPRPM